MKAIIGLGNPGRKYAGTRHNVGFEVVDRLAARHGIQVAARRCQALIGEGEIAGARVLLVKPQTYMNLSGLSLQSLSRRFRLQSQDMLVICDDTNLPLGRIRIRASGSAGGHNGLKSIIGCLGTQDFPRLRIGIGSSESDMIDHVLSRFEPDEGPVMLVAYGRAVEAVEYILENGLEKAMNMYNASKDLTSPASLP